MQLITGIINQISALIQRIGLRKPSRKYFMFALSGNALMVWTPTGNIVVSSETARKLSRQLDLMADQAEEYHVNHQNL